MSPLIRNTTIGVGGTAVAVAIYFTAIIGGNYQGLILQHLASLVQGNNTKTLVSQNAPNWGFGTPLATPQIASVGTTTGGSLASSTPLSIKIAALDGDGTTTVSEAASVSTDASTTLLAAEAVNIRWSPVPGAQGYAIFISTTTPASYAFYALASSTSGLPNAFYYLATTSSLLSGSYTKDDTTAFSNRLLPGFSSFLNGGPVGIGTSTPASSTPLDVNGYVRAQRNGTSTECFAGTQGVIFFNTANGHEWGCNGISWQLIF